jgi:transposase
MPDSHERLLVGIDWAIDTHQLCALDREGMTVAERSVPHSGAGLITMADWLIERAGGDPAAVAVAIERPDGPVVECLLDRQIKVYTLNPKQLDRFRDRYSPAGAKDDRRDALVLASALRTDRPAFRQVVLDQPELIQLRELVRIDDDLRAEENRLNNRLIDQLRRYYPQLLELAADRCDPFLWDLWELAQTPAQARALRPAVLRRLMAKHHIRRFSLEQLQQALRATDLPVAQGTVAAAIQHIALLLPRLRLVHQQRRQCGRQTEALLTRLAAPSEQSAEGQKRQHPDAAILRSLPGVGTAVLARMLTDGSDPIRHRDLNRLRALGGSAPVTRSSGKSRQIAMRRACNARLRYAFYHWARTAVQRDERARGHYASLRSRGHNHGRALRGVVDRLLSVAIALLRTGTFYDAQRRQSRRAAPAQDQHSGGVLLPSAKSP